MKKLLSKIVSAGFGLWLSSIFVPQVRIVLYPDSNFFGFSITQQWQIFLILGIILGLLNYFIKPILKIITLPLTIITFGLFSFVVNIALLFVVDMMFRELSVPLFWPIIETTIVIGIVNFIISNFVLKSSG